MYRDPSFAAHQRGLLYSRGTRFAVAGFILALLFQAGFVPLPPPVRAAELPVASFTPTTQTVGAAPLGVAFLDTSTGEPSSWLWSFGDGDTSSQQNAVHTYRKPGRYTVTLTVANVDGSDTKVRQGLVVVEELLSLSVTPMVDPQFASTISNGHLFTDHDHNTNGTLTGSAPNDGFYYDLGDSSWITKVRVKAMHATSAYSSRIRIWGSNADPTGTPAWTQIYDTMTATSEGGLRTFVIDEANAGPWRYIRFQVVSRSIGSATPRWYVAEAFGAEPTAHAAVIDANFSVNQTSGPMQGGTALPPDPEPVDPGEMWPTSPSNDFESMAEAGTCVGDCGPGPWTIVTSTEAPSGDAYLHHTGWTSTMLLPQQITPQVSYNYRLHARGGWLRLECWNASNVRVPMGGGSPYGRYIYIDANATTFTEYSGSFACGPTTAKLVIVSEGALDVDALYLSNSDPVATPQMASGFIADFESPDVFVDSDWRYSGSNEGARQWRALDAANAVDGQHIGRVEGWDAKTAWLGPVTPGTWTWSIATNNHSGSYLRIECIGDNDAHTAPTYGIVTISSGAVHGWQTRMGTITCTAGTTGLRLAAQNQMFDRLIVQPPVPANENVVRNPKTPGKVNYASSEYAASASATTNSGSAGAALDRNDSTYWESASPNGGEALLVDLIQPQLINQFRLLQGAANYNVAVYEIQHADAAGGPWTTVATVGGSLANSGPVTFDGGPVSARFWRANTVTAGAGAWRIHSFELGLLGTKVTYSAANEYAAGYTAELAANGNWDMNSGATGVSWATSGHAAGDWWQVNWNTPQSIARVRLFDRFGAGANFGSGELQFSDGSTIDFDALSDSSPAEITFPTKTGITTLRVVADGTGSGDAGLAEVEAYGAPQPDGFPVEFRDISTGDVTAWLWDFGDDTTSTEQHPTHTYTEPGAYTVSLRVTDAQGASSTITRPNFIVYEGGQISSTTTPPAALNGAAFWNSTDGSVLADGLEVVDMNDASFDYLSGCCPHSFYLDLGAPQATSSVQVSTRYKNSSAYASRIRIWGSNDAASWTMLHDDMSNVGEGGPPRLIRLAPEDHGPWRYVRFEQVSRSIGGGAERWLVARVFGATPIAPTGDFVNPIIEFVTPPTGEYEFQAGAGYTVEWAESDTGSGVDGRSIQRQRAPLTTGECPTDPIEWLNDGAASTAGSPRTDSDLLSDYCYRWRATISDLAGNQATYLSGTVGIDGSAPDEPTVTDNIGSGASPLTYRNGDAIFFDPSSAGSVELTASGSDPQTIISGHTFTFSDERPGGYLDGEPQTRAVTWEQGAVAFTVSITSTNAAGLESAARDIVFTPDSDDPVVTFTSPAAGTQVRTAIPDLDIEWSESDNDTGIAERQLQRQRAAAGGIGQCAAATYANHGDPVTAAAPVSETELEPGYCYRWQITVRDFANRSASATSGLIYIAQPPAPVAVFTNPAPDYEVVTSINVDDSDALTGWPGNRVLVGDDYEMSLGGITVRYYGPKYAAEPGQVFRMSMRAFPSGPHAWFGICFYDAAGTELACPAGGKIAEGDQRASLQSRLATAPTGTAEVAISLYHVYYTSYYDDVILERIDLGADRTVGVEDALDVSWTEAEAEDGLPIATRSLQRQVAAAADWSGCRNPAWTDDGAPSDAISPVEEQNLAAGNCYRWVQMLTDTEGNSTPMASGTVYVVDHQLEIHAAPVALEGSPMPVSVMIRDRHGQPRDDFFGTLTLSSDASASFPGGSTFKMQGPDDLSGHTFRVRFNSAGTHAVTVRGPNAQTTSITIDVAGVDLVADAPAQVFAGAPFFLTTTPVDGDGKLVPTYVQTITFASSDPSPTFYDTAGSPASKAIECTCDGGDQTLVRLMTPGVQTITVTDPLGNSDTVTVEVLAAPSGGTNPISRIDGVQWNHGQQVDMYVTAFPTAVPFTILGGDSQCGENAYEFTPLNIKVDPALDRYTELMLRVPNGGICPGLHLSEIWNHRVFAVTDQGHFFTVGPTQRHWRFSNVPGNSNFRMLSPGDPIADYAVTARPGGEDTLDYGDHRWAWGEGTLKIDFAAYESAQIYEMHLGRPGITGYYAPWGPLRKQVVPGITSLSFDDITHVCYIGPSWQNVSSGWIRYTSGGYRGAIANGGGILAGPGSTSANCSDANPGDGTGDLNDFLNALNPKNWANQLNGINDGFNRFLEGDPVDPFNGSFTLVVSDFTLGGLSPSVELTRTYRSDRAEAAAAGDPNTTGMFGRGWASTFDRRLIIDDGGAQIRVIGDDGGYATFTRDESGDYQDAHTSGASLSLAGTEYRLTSSSGTYTRYDATGRLLAVGDRSGREMTFAHSGAQLATVTDSAGRTATITMSNGLATRIDLSDGRHVAFTYDADGDMATSRDLAGNVTKWTTDNRGRITAVRDAADDVLLTNLFDGQGRLIEQTDALGFTSFFAYNSAQRMTSFIDPRGAVSVSCYDAAGRLTSRRDAEGGARSWTYDHNGHAASATDELGATTRFRHDDAGRVTEVTDPLGHAVSLTYRPDGQVANATDKAGNQMIASYDESSGLPMSITRRAAVGDPEPDTLTVGEITYTATQLPETMTDAVGGVTTFEYDSRGYLAATLDAEGRRTTFVTDARGYVSEVVDPAGNVTGANPVEHAVTSTHDDMGRLLTSTNQLGQTTTYAYDAWGRVESVTTPLGIETSYDYNLAGQVMALTTQLSPTESAITTFEYDPAGNLAATIDAELRRSEFEYDLLGRVTIARDPSGAETLTEYDAAGQVVRMTDPTGRSTQTEYDAAGRAERTIDSAGRATEYDYNDDHTLASVTDPLGNTTSYVYDWLGRTASVTNGEQETTTFDYDNAGRLTSVSDPLQNATTFSYNLAGQLELVVDAESGEWSFAYDGAGQLTSRTNARNKSETFGYDDTGRMTAVIDALGNRWESHYDADGRVAYTIDANEQRTDFVYDDAGRLLTLTPDTGAAVNFAYDDTGRRMTMIDGNGTTTYGYDSTGRMTSLDRNGRTVGYDYDAAGRPTEITYPGSVDSATYDYDAAGRLETITDWANRTTGFAYDDASRVTAITRPNGVETGFGYDDANRPTAISHVRNNVQLLALGYTYDDAGRLTAMSDDTGTASFTYDDLGRLLTADYPAADDHAYGYDAVGNMTSLTRPGESTITRTYDDADRLIAEGDGIVGQRDEGPTTHDSGWSSSANGDASDDAYATASPSNNSTTTVRYDGFDFSDLPAEASNITVTLEVEWAVDKSNAQATLRAQGYLGSTAVGAELVNASKPTSDTTDAVTLTGLTRADLLSGNLAVEVSASKGSGTGFTARLDAVTVTADYMLPPRAFTYDDNGALLDDGLGRTFDYDALGRLVEVDDGTDVLTYTLDGEGNRWAETLGATTTNFDLDLSGMSSVLSDGTRRYLPGDPGAGFEIGGVWHTGLTDMLGTPMAHVDATGALSPIRHLDPFGAPRGSTAAASSEFGFTGEWIDPMGLVNLRFRAYDPTLQRFFGRDTYAGVAGAGQSWNRYAYAGNNPLTVTDPSGHLWNAITQNPGEVASVFASLATFGGYDAIVALTGRDWLAGRDVAEWERALYGMGALPFIGLAAKGMARVGSKAITAAKSVGTRLAAPRSVLGLVDVATSAGDLARAETRLMRVGSRSSAARLTSDAGQAAARRHAPRKFHYGDPGPGALGSTDKFGGITIRPGLSRRDLAETLRHESVHARLSPSRTSFLAGFRADLRMEVYQRSRVFRFTEEALAEAYARRNTLDGLRFPLEAGYVSPIGLAWEVAAIGGASYFAADVLTGD